MTNNQLKILASGVKDVIIVWGTPECPNCQMVKMRLKGEGYEYEERDIEKDLPKECPVVRNDVMAAYTDAGVLPVVQINAMACTVEEAYNMLTVKGAI